MDEAIIYVHSDYSGVILAHSGPMQCDEGCESGFSWEIMQHGRETMDHEALSPEFLRRSPGLYYLQGEWKFEDSWDEHPEFELVIMRHATLEDLQNFNMLI